MTDITIDCAIYSPQLDAPMERFDCISLEDIINLIELVPEDVFFDFYLDVYNNDNYFEESTFALCGQTSPASVITEVRAFWDNLIYHKLFI